MNIEILSLPVDYDILTLPYTDNNPNSARAYAEFLAWIYYGGFDLRYEAGSKIRTIPQMPLLIIRRSASMVSRWLCSFP